MAQPAMQVKMRPCFMWRARSFMPSRPTPARGLRCKASKAKMMHSTDSMGLYRAITMAVLQAPHRRCQSQCPAVLKAHRMRISTSCRPRAWQSAKNESLTPSSPKPAAMHITTSRSSGV